MSDQRIQYTEEMVGANHPTKSDTLNRLALVEADVDGHGKARFLKEQTAAPSPASGEGVIYTQNNGGYTCLHYKANGQSVMVARPGALANIPMGYISGLQQSWASASTITIQAGMAEAGGVLYTLPEDITITAVTSSALAWRAVEFYPPITGTVLTSACFNTYSLASYSLTRRDASWYLVDAANPNRRVIGLYPSAGGEVLFYRTVGGEYRFDYLILDTETPPTVATETNIGLPVGFPAFIYADYTATIRASAGTQLFFYFNNNIPMGLRQASSTTVIGCTGPCTMWSNTGTGSIHLLGVGGTPNLLQIAMRSMRIPAGLAR